jgi:hypothetical protein
MRDVQLGEEKLEFDGSCGQMWKHQFQWHFVELDCIGEVPTSHKLLIQIRED